jgi:TPR repeat protein
MGVAHDDAAAVRWYQKAANQGDSHAQTNLGACNQNGRGVPQDDATAVSWHQKAADQGNANAQNNLGLMYLNGYGVSQRRGGCLELVSKGGRPRLRPGSGQSQAHARRPVMKNRAF